MAIEKLIEGTFPSCTSGEAKNYFILYESIK